MPIEIERKHLLPLLETSRNLETMGTIIAARRKEPKALLGNRAKAGVWADCPHATPVQPAWSGRMSWQRTLRRLIPYAIASGLLIGLQHSPLVETSNLLVYDLAISLRNRTNHASEEPLAWPITVVGINEADLKRYSWPLDDRLLCSALQRINGLGASAIGSISTATRRNRVSAGDPTQSSSDFHSQ